MELDISNNLLANFDTQIFWNNQDLQKVIFESKILILPN